MEIDKRIGSNNNEYTLLFETWEYESLWYWLTCIKEKEHQVLASANVVSSFTDQNNTEYVTFQYQPDELYNCEGQSYDLGESTLTYEIPVVHQEFGDNSTNTTTFVELQVVQEEEPQCKAIETGIIKESTQVVRFLPKVNF